VHILDTNVYLDYWKRGLSAEVVTRPGVCLSALVLAELLAGWRDDRKALQRWAARFQKRRFLVPGRAAYELAGVTLAQLRQRGLVWQGMFNDVLIAMNARLVGATVLTRDRGFIAISRIEKFRLEIL
jgi:predicted nucleic acid-binding protein